MPLEPHRVLLLSDDARLDVLLEVDAPGLRFERGSYDDILANPGGLERALILLDTDAGSDRCAFVLLRSLRAADCGVPVVGLVGGGSIDDAIAYLRLGADDVLRKPLREGELRAAVRRLLPPEAA